MSDIKIVVTSDVHEGFELWADVGDGYHHIEVTRMTSPDLVSYLEGHIDGKKVKVSEQ